jgi:hypothetical protein
LGLGHYLSKLIAFLLNITDKSNPKIAGMP